MANKKNWLGMLLMLLMTLVFGMTVVGCSRNLDSALFGVWVHVEDSGVLTFNRDGTFSWEFRGNVGTGVWSTENGIITYMEGGETYTEPYIISNRELFIDGYGPYRKR